MRRVSAALVATAGFVLVSLGTLGASGQGAHALTNCTVADFSLDGEEQAFFMLINNYRAQNGLGMLTHSTNLDRDAAWMVNDLATNAYFSHTDSLGRAPYARAIDCGYPSGAGENLAAGSLWSTAQAAFDAWKASPGHNANMLQSYYRQIGIARLYRAGSPYGWYWATEFGADDDGTGGSPPPPPTATPTRTPTPTSTPTQSPNPTVTPPAATSTPTPASTNPPPTSTPPSTATQPAAPTSTPKSQPQLPPATTTPSASPTSVPTSAPTQAPTAAPTQPPPAPSQTPAALALLPGANLVAWPAADAAPRNALAGMGVAIVYAWDPVSATWLHFSPDLPDVLNSLRLLRRGEGYWIIARDVAQVAVGWWPLGARDG